MDINNLKFLYTEINREFAELQAAAEKRLELWQIVPEIIEELKAEHFNQLPQKR
jgi:hypothetical protein